MRTKSARAGVVSVRAVVDDVGAVKTLTTDRSRWNGAS